MYIKGNNFTYKAVFPSLPFGGTAVTVVELRITFPDGVLEVIPESDPRVHYKEPTADVEVDGVITVPGTDGYFIFGGGFDDGNAVPPINNNDFPIVQAGLHAFRLYNAVSTLTQLAANNFNFVASTPTVVIQVPRT